MTGTSAACLHTNQSRSYLNHLLFSSATCHSQAHVNLKIINLKITYLQVVTCRRAKYREVLPMWFLCDCHWFRLSILDIQGSFFYMCCSVHFYNNNYMYPTNAHSLLCKTLHRFANMFRSRRIIIRAPHTLNIGMLLYTTHIRSYKMIYSVHTIQL
jgi:hypothetical protein